MKKFTCPKCNHEGISLKDKYLASIWQVIYCGSCGARLCARPWAMACTYGVYTWAVISFITMAYYQKSLMPFVYLVGVWLILDIHNVAFMPLAIMRQGNKPS